MKQNIFKNQGSLLATLVTLLIALSIGANTASATAAEWTVDGNVVTFADNVGYSADGTASSGTVSLRMESVIVSGQFKIITTIVSVEPAAGFGFSIKKGGGVNGSVEIEFASATCQSKFSFLYKPGLTRIDYGEMRCR